METIAQTPIKFGKKRSELSPEELKALRAYDARSQKKSRDKKRVEEGKEIGWTRERAFKVLKSQGVAVYPETEWVLRAIWKRYWDPQWNIAGNQHDYFELYRDFPEGREINPAAAVLWPVEVWDCIFGEILAGTLAPNREMELDVIRELAKVLRHRDVTEGDSIRSYYTSVWRAWGEQGFPMYCRTSYPMKLVPGTPPAGWTGDIIHDGYVFDEDADRPIDVSTLKALHPLR